MEISLENLYLDIGASMVNTAYWSRQTQVTVINSKPTVTVAIGFPVFVFLSFEVTWPCHWLCLLCCSFGCFEVMIKW